MKGMSSSPPQSLSLPLVIRKRGLIRQYSVDEEEIEAQTDALRKKLLKESERGGGPGKKGLKMHQVHELAEAKIKQDDRFRSALGIRKDYVEGGHWKKQEEKLKAAAEKESQANDEEK